MKSYSRRSLLAFGGSGLLAASMLAGCATTKVGTVTTTTLNVAKINDYVQAGINAANTVINIIQVIPSFASKVTLIQDIVDKLQAVSNDFTAAAGGKIEVSYAQGNIKVLVNSILDLVIQLSDTIATITLSLVKATFKISPSSVIQAQLVQDSIKTIAMLLKAMLRSSTDYAEVTPLSSNMKFAEYKALKTLGV